MRKFAVMLIALCMFIGQTMAQTTKLTGRVTDSKDGSPLSGVTVSLKNGKGAVRTDANGAFTIIVSEKQVLVFSFVGYTQEEKAVGKSGSMNVTMLNNDKQLDEVVVTAYGTTKKRAFTGTASTVGSEKFKDLQVSSVTNVLQGQASGVLAVSSNGQPGESPTIRIRGIGSINASSDPLIILDGAPYGGNINSINPNDIESITVLKDASSTALYGSRAANGVLEITTKVGRGTPKVSLTGLNGYSSRAVNDYSYVNSSQLYQLTWEALKNEATLNPSLVTGLGAASAADYASKSVVGTLIYNPFGVAQPVGVDGQIVAGAKSLWNEDWGKDLQQTGVRKEVNGSISGGGEATKYFVSGGYLDDQGVPIQSDFKRYTGRVKIDTKVNSWLTAGVNTNLAYSTQNYPAQTGSSYSNVVQWIRTVSSIYPQYLLDPTTGANILDANGNKQFDFGNNGSLKRPILTPGNPAGTTSLNPTTYNRFITSGNVFAEAQIVKGLKIRSQFALDYYQYAFNQYYNPFVGDGAAYGGRSEKLRESTITQTFTNTATYDKQFANVHHVNIVVGTEVYKYHDEDVDAESRVFTFPGVTELSYGSTPYTATSASYDNRMISYFSRLNYDYTEKYHLSLSLRRDGSSRFADSVRWGTFYSVGGAWNINKETFLSDVKSLSDLKLRASYGTTGNQNTTAYYPYLGGYAAGANIANYSGSVISSLTNGSLTWETQKTLDVGIDFGLFKNRITGSFTYFTRTSDKLLFARPLPPSSGIGSIQDNIGTLKNHGIEIDLTTVNVRTRNFEWTTSFNISHITNKITALPQTSIAGAGYSNLIVGQSLYNFYIREYAGVDQTDGTPMWYIDNTDATGKVTKGLTKTWSAATRYYKGTSLPDYTGGISNTFHYRNLDLTVLASFSIGGYIYDGSYAGLSYGTTGTSGGSNWSTDILGRWQSPSNPGDGKTPKLMATTDYTSTSASTRFLYSASFSRIRNITLGYRLPHTLLSRAKIASARFYADFQNPFTFFGRKGLDPEEGGLGKISGNSSVVYKTISVGLNLDF